MEAIIPALVTKLRADSNLMSLVTGIFDDVPQGQTFPFIAFGEISEVPFNTFGRSGRTSTITLNILSQYKGFKEATEIYAAVNEILDGQPLTLENHELVSFQFRQSEFLQDGEIRHIPVMYNIITQEG